MNKIKKFVSKILKGLFNDDDKQELIKILTTSLEEKVDDLVEEGTPVDEAIAKSITEFGDAKDILEAFPDKVGLKKKLIHHRKNQFSFSFAGYLIICGIAIFFNLQFLDFFQGILWLFVVVIGVLFWPLTMLYLYFMAKR